MQVSRERAEKALDRWLPPARARPRLLHEAMRYSAQGGGKRLRPVLLLAAHSLYPSKAEPAPAAAAIECLHAYSLIHDDLPCLDDSPLRRGRPSCHAAFGEAAALLAGDALLTRAFWIAAEAYREMPPLASALSRELSAAAGSRRLIAGQMEDVLGEGRAVTPEELDFIHRHKTAALFEAALVTGLLLTEAPEKAFSLIRRAGRCFGLAYQIADDLLDAAGRSLETGKPGGQDARRQKNTYVSAHGFGAAREQLRTLTEQAVKTLEQLDADTAFLSWLMASCAERSR